MDWIHCNTCFLLPDGGKCFFLTSCGHIFCNDCEQQRAGGRCKLCGNQCTAIPLSSTMKPDVQKYFLNPTDLLKKSLKEIQQVSEFQKNHRARLLTYYKKQHNKLRQMKDDFRKILKTVKELESERRKLSKENDCLKKYFGMLSKQDGNASVADVSSLYGARKGHFISPSDKTPVNPNINPVFSKYFGKLDSVGSHASMPERLSVFSPPMNGKIGAIPGTPSPLSSFQRLVISSENRDEALSKRNYDQTPSCSQDSAGSSRYDCFTSRPSPVSSPLDAWNIQKKAVQSKKDTRKVVVHPYSPSN